MNKQKVSLHLGSQFINQYSYLWFLVYQTELLYPFNLEVIRNIILKLIVV